MLRRRLITIPGYLIAWSVCLAAAPLWVPLALLIDAARRRPRVAFRIGALLAVYLSCEIAGMLASAGLWVWKRTFGIDAERWMDLHFRLEAWWGTTLFRAVALIFGLRLEVDGDADLERGPYLLLLRHTSMGDTLLASALVSGPKGLRLRYVLKKELLWDPSLDIVGNRIPNVFVDRFSDDSPQQIRRVQALARDLGPRDGILIYPEGTRFSESKRRRLIERLQEKGDVKMLEEARSLTFVLPPRFGGTMGLLEAAPRADVVVCAHTGFESVASLEKIWNGELLHQVIRVQFRRIPRALIPTERDARILWAFEEWRRVDDWVGRNQSSPWK